MSGMFDDWAYHQVYEPPYPPQTPSKESNRAISRSIVHSVALSPNIPSPQVRARAQSVGHALPKIVSSAHPEITTDDPLTKQETQRLWSKEEWLGSLSPSVYNFDKQLWSAQVKTFKNAQDEAKLASILAKEAEMTARSLIQDVVWLLHELRDTREHDLAPLREASNHKLGLEKQIETASNVKSALSVVWDAQDKILRNLRGPAPKAVPKLPSILKSIDEGLAFCDAHPDFLEIEQARMVLRTCAQRSLAIGGAYFAHNISKVVNSIKSRAAESKSQPGMRQALLYSKFSTDMAKFRQVVSLVRAHGSKPIKPHNQSSKTTANLGLQIYWSDMQTTYFSSRFGLIQQDAASYAELLLRFTELNDEFIDAARTVLVQYKELHAEEQQVFELLMGPATPEFWTWLAEDVSDPLYNAMRRMIVQETDIAKLGQLIVLIDSNGDQDLENPQIDHVDPFDLIYRDAQNRLIFRANLAIDALAKYEPTNREFLKARYPTVEQALSLLGQVYQLLSAQVFNDLAHRCIRECLLSLDSAVANKVSSASGIDAVKIHLFHIKQLLVLQLQIVDFDLHNTVVQEVDFSGIQRLISRDNRNLSFRDIITLAWDSVPRVVEIMFDAMEELYISLRRAVGRMCDALVAEVAKPLHNVNNDVSKKFRDKCSAEFEKLLVAIPEYTRDVEVTNFLVDSAQEAVMNKYTVFYRNLPTPQHKSEDLMDIDTMASWMSASIVEARKQNDRN